jgi:lysophospholipase L1-like esterase
MVVLEDTGRKTKDSTIIPNDPIIIPKDSIPVPKDSTVIPKDTVVTPKDPVVPPKDTVVTPKDPVVVPDPVVPPKDPVVIPDPIVPPKDPVIPSINIIFDGDSQTKREYYPNKLIELLKGNGYSNVKSVNIAVSGQNTLNMISDVKTQILPKYNASYTKNIVCYWIGANDAIKDALTDTAKLYSNLLLYYNTLKKAGFKVLLINLPDANHHVGTNKVNAMYARVYSKISDVYVNCRETGGAFEKNTNLTYYTSDGIHLSTNGFQYLASKYVYPKFVLLTK